MILAAPQSEARIYAPHGGARDLFECADGEVLLEGPAGTGKTFAVCNYILGFVEAFPGSRVLMLRKERRSLTETVLVTFEDKVLPMNHSARQGPRRSHRDAYHFPNGSEVVCGGMDNPLKVMSGEYDLIVCFEATGFFESDWEQLTTRLRNGKAPYQQIIADCNPEGPSHWLNRRAHEGKMTRIVTRHEDNPMLWDAERGEWTEVGVRYMGKLESLSGARYHRLRQGLWAASEGVVYDRFDSRVHVKKRGGPWKRSIVACDDGYTNPFVSLLIHEDGDGRLHVESETYMSKLLLESRVRAVERYGRMSNPESVVVDPAAADLKAALRNADLPVKDANNEVFDGICRVQDRLKVQPDGYPRLTFDPGCGNLLSEIEGYVWKKRRVNADDDDRKDEPEKINDHAMDALRYGVSHFDDKNAMRFEVISSGDSDTDVDDDDFGFEEAAWETHRW